MQMASGYRMQIRVSLAGPAIWVVRMIPGPPVAIARGQWVEEAETVRAQETVEPEALLVMLMIAGNPGEHLHMEVLLVAQEEPGMLPTAVQGVIFRDTLPMDKTDRLEIMAIPVMVV